MIGGAGGNKGPGGEGGKVFTVSQAVTAGEKIAYAAGVGGAAVGANGDVGTHNANDPNAWSYRGEAGSSTNPHGKAYAIAYGGTGGNGGNAAAPAKASKYGAGGTGGNGGGGAGGGGFAYGEKRVSKEYPPTECSVSGNKGQSGTPGLGSDGGQGGDGCIIIYYRKFGKQQAGPLVQRGGGLVFDRLQRLFIV